jgi:hypothetical protein
MQPPYQKLVHQLRSCYPGTRDREAHKVWQAAVYRAAGKVQDVEREVFIYMCLSAHASACGNGA